MDSSRHDEERAYRQIREQIISLELPPGTRIDEKQLADGLDLDLLSVQEALKLLADDKLVEITPRQEYGTDVTNIHLEDLDQLSETRLALEVLCARLAAQRATPNDLAKLEALRQEHPAGTSPADQATQWFEVDLRFHQAIAQAAQNRYLADALEHLFGLSRRLRHLAEPRLDFLPASIEKHLELVEAVRVGDADRAAQIMHRHVQEFYDRVRVVMTARVTVSYGRDTRFVVVQENSALSAAVIATGLPLEQPCAGRGTCHKCKVIAQGALSPLEEEEREGLTDAERRANYRLACRTRVRGDASVTLAPIVVYSNKMFRTSSEYKRKGVPLGLAIDLGSTTVAAFTTTLIDGKACAGAAALNQQIAFGADVISRLSAAQEGAETAERVSLLAMSSIVQAVDALKLSPQVRERIQKVTIVGNCAMHHLLLRYPVDTLATVPFEPYAKAAVRDSDQTGSSRLFGDTFPAAAHVALPPLIGGFVGSDALACRAYYDFDRAPGPMAAIDRGTKGEVMVTDGKRILVTSTAAGPAFEGVNISCGTRAVDGAIVGVKVNYDKGALDLTTIGGHPPVGLTGSGLLELVCGLRTASLIDRSGRLVTGHPLLGHLLSQDDKGVWRVLVTERGVDLRGVQQGEEGTPIPLYLTQHDIRELQKAKGAIRASAEILMGHLGLNAGDLQGMILTGSFGSKLNVDAVLGLGMIPSVDPNRVETSANGAGLGAALFLNDEQFARGEQIAARAEQIDLDSDADFYTRYVEGMELPGGHCE